jgi:hypothetical protein
MIIYHVSIYLKKFICFTSIFPSRISTLTQRPRFTLSFYIRRNFVITILWHVINLMFMLSFDIMKL